MGIQWSSTSTRMMKSIFFAAVIAAAYADSESKAENKASEPSSYGYQIMEFIPYSYGMQPYGIAGFPHMMKRSADADAYHHGYNFGGFRGHHFHAMGKRSADVNAY